MKKCIVTVVGKDTIGIIGKICMFFAESKVNIIDISQTIIGGYFNMMMVVDASEATKTFANLDEGLSKIGDEIGVKVKIQRAEIFDMMHRV